MRSAESLAAASEVGSKKKMKLKGRLRALLLMESTSKSWGRWRRGGGEGREARA